MSDNILLPGFRFYPTEEELISFYLLHKIQGKQFDTVIPVVHIYDYNPWDLPKYAGELCRGDPEQWFFFLPKQEREGRGGRHNRLTAGGYWKATGSPGDVYSSSGAVIGRKRTMVFYMGRAPKGTKTAWKMNEYKAIDPVGQAASSSTNTQLSEEFSVCRVYKKSKCLRSFDRRPTEAAEGGRPAMHHHQDDHDNEAPSTSEQSYIATSDHAINARSFGSPPSEEHAANSDSNMALENEALWDLEQFDKWFD